MKKKWLSIFLVLAMVLGMMPAMAFAKDTATASVRIVGSNNTEFITYKTVEIEDGVTTMEGLVNKAVVTSGAAITLNGWGFVDTIDGCDINGDSWMCMLNDDGSAFNTGDFTTVTASDGDVLVLYPYGNGNYAWINAAERADVNIFDYTDENSGITTDYITGFGAFILNESGYDAEWNPYSGPVEGATVRVTGPDGAALGDYDVSVKSVTTDDDGIFKIDFYGSCAPADLNTFALTYELYAEKNGINTAFCQVVLTKDGLTFSQPEGDAGSIADPIEKPNVSYEALITKIASDYAARSTLDNWQVIGMSAYNVYDPNSPNKLSAAFKQDFVNAAVAAAAGSPGEQDLGMMTIALQGSGYDPQQLYQVDSENAIDLIEMMDGTAHSTDAWTAAFTMAAYAQNSATKEKGKEIADAVLATQNANGSFESWGARVDATALMIAGLSFYADDAAVKTAIDNAVDFLATVQKTNGTFDAYGYGPDADTAAVVVIGLCAAGVDPATDPRFVKDGFSALDGLLVYALADNSGFGYQDNATLNEYATKQAFPALIAAANVANGKKPFNVFDFSGNTDLEPAKATGTVTPSTPADPTGDDITVKVTVKTLDDSWLNNYKIEIPGDGATAYYALTKAFEANNIEYKVKSGSYIYELTYDGTTMGEFDEGPNSGWLYKVNGKLPTVATGEYSVKNGDTILFYYTEDWTKDPDAASNAGLTEPETAGGEETNDNYFVDVKDSDWYDEYAEKAAELGLFAGYEAGTDEEGKPVYEFRGSETMTRAMFVTVLRAINIKLKGETESAPDAGFADVADGAWYEEAVNWAYAEGITAGKGGSFGVDDPVTREQMAVFLYAYAKSAGKVTGEVDLSKLEGFSDADEISDYAKEAIAWLVGEGLMAGRGGGKLAPGATSTRAEVAAFLVNAYEYLSK